MKERAFVLGSGMVGFVSGLVLLATGSILLGGLMIVGAGALLALAIDNI